MDVTRVNRLRIRAWRRGIREADLIMGPFADLHGPTLSEADLAAFETLLDLPDPDVYAWMIGQAPTPAEYDTPLMDRLKAFCVSGQPAKEF